MPTLGQLTSNRAPVTVRFDDGEELHVEYYPRKLTTDMLITFAAMEEMASLSSARVVEVLSSGHKMLLDLLASWDLRETPQDTQPIPITSENLARLGLQLQWTILNGIMQAGNGSGASEGEAPAPERGAQAQQAQPARGSRNGRRSGAGS